MWNLEAVRDWLHRCIEEQPEICEVAKGFGWVMSPAYYYLRMRHNFAFRSTSFNQYSIVSAPGFSETTCRLDAEELRLHLAKAKPASRIRLLLQQVYAAKDSTAFEPWSDLDFFFDRPIAVVQITSNYSLKYKLDSPAMLAQIKVGDYAIAAFGEQGRNNWILTACGAEIPFALLRTAEYPTAGATRPITRDTNQILYTTKP